MATLNPQNVDDTQGNVLGQRATFVYTSNEGTIYNITQDASVADAMGNTRSQTSGRPTLYASAKRPLKPRYILLQGGVTGAKSKKVVIGSEDNVLFSGLATTVTINGTPYTIKTRVGERRAALPVAAPPA